MTVISKQQRCRTIGQGIGKKGLLPFKVGNMNGLVACPVSGRCCDHGGNRHADQCRLSVQVMFICRPEGRGGDRNGKAAAPFGFDRAGHDGGIRGPGVAKDRFANDFRKRCMGKGHAARAHVVGPDQVRTGQPFTSVGGCIGRIGRNRRNR